jgi:hypothetical protein
MVSPVRALSKWMISVSPGNTCKVGAGYRLSPDISPLDAVPRST